MIKALRRRRGRGMRLVEQEADFASLLASAQREAEAAFGDSRILIREVDHDGAAAYRVQVFGDTIARQRGHLFERDAHCKRRNQKVVEKLRHRA